MNQKQKPLIFISNDDGIYAEGIKNLVEVATDFGQVVVVAPDGQRSGQSHAITVHDPLYFEKTNIFEGKVDAYICSGTPADCVKIGLQKIISRRPDLCLSGINHGTNASIGVLYSGTIAVALEAATKNIPAIALSVDDHDLKADFSQAMPTIKKIIQTTLQNGLPQQTALNVNFPKASEESYKGVKICHQARGIWQEAFDSRSTPWGKKYHWLHGDFQGIDDRCENDMEVMKENYVAVVPLKIDMTDYNAMNQLKKWNL